MELEPIAQPAAGQPLVEHRADQRIEVEVDTAQPVAPEPGERQQVLAIAAALPWNACSNRVCDSRAR